MMKTTVVALLVVLAVSNVSARPLVSPALKEAYSTKANQDIMIIMKAKTSTVLASVQSQNFVNTNAKATTLYNELNRFTAASQRDVKSILSKFTTAKVQGFYITNRISVKNAPQELVEALMEREDIEEIRQAKVIKIDAVIQPADQEAKVLEWGVSKINSPEAW